MNKTRMISILLLVATLVVALLSGCGQQAAGAATTAPATSGETQLAALANDPGGLDATNQLALGTLNLEGTADAVTQAQAARLLPLWQALSGSELQSDTERTAVVVQIEATMTGDQVSAIAAMRLTQQDAQAWMQDQGLAAGALAPAGGQIPAGDAVPANRSTGMSSDQLAAMRAQLAPASSASGGLSQGVISAVVELLAERSTMIAAQAAEPVTVEPAEVQVASTPEAAALPPAQETSPAAVEVTGTPALALEQETAPASEPAATPEPVTYVVQAGDTLAAIAQAYGVTVQAIVEANGIADPNAIAVGQELVIPDPAQVPALLAVALAVPAAGSSVATVETLPGLEQIADSNPAPPFTIEISANYAIQDPLVEASRRYIVTGIVRNDGDETYAVSSILVTFYDADGFRGTFAPAMRDGKLVGGEWHWHAETDAEFAALLLAPGEEWPFRVEITAQDMVSFLIHPDAAPTGRESAQVELSDVRLIDEGTGYLRVSGTATNVNPFEVKNVAVSGVLLGAGGKMFSMGSTYVLQEDIEPGEAVRFEVCIEKEGYASYQLYAQAERDWQ